MNAVLFSTDIRVLSLQGVTFKLTSQKRYKNQHAVKLGKYTRCTTRTFVLLSRLPFQVLNAEIL